MLLIDALVMVAQEYSNEQGWIASCEHGQLMSAPSRRGAYYYAHDEHHTLIIGSPRLEVALSALLERKPAGARDEHWKIEPCTQEA